jgi:hypothetical protein
MSRAEIVTRRRKWRPEEKAALPAEVEAEGGGSVSSLTAGEGPLRVWPPIVDGSMTLTPAQLALLSEGVQEYPLC